MKHSRTERSMQNLFADTKALFFFFFFLDGLHRSLPDGSNVKVFMFLTVRGRALCHQVAALCWLMFFGDSRSEPECGARPPGEGEGSRCNDDLAAYTEAFRCVY